jgi:hypothetical protein
MGAIFHKEGEKMKEKKSVILFYDLLYALDVLDDTQIGTIMRALIEYELYDLECSFKNRRLNSIYEMGKHQLDRGREIFHERYGK